MLKFDKCAFLIAHSFVVYVVVVITYILVGKLLNTLGNDNNYIGRM